MLECWNVTVDVGNGIRCWFWKAEGGEVLWGERRRSFQLRICNLECPFISSMPSFRESKADEKRSWFIFRTLEF